jgi:suppressor of fused-like protein
MPADEVIKEPVHTLACGCTAKMAPGWAALEHALETAHAAPPVYFSAAEDADDDTPVESVACFPAASPEPHWHLISCGLSELYDKRFLNVEVSGFGFELTMRVPKAPGEEEPPAWPMQLMRNLARYVQAVQKPFAEGDHMDAHAPLALDVPCTLSAVCFVEDPLLGAIRTPNGAVSFLQVLGLTDDELEKMMDGDAHHFIALVAQQNPSFISGAARPSYLEDEEMMAKVHDQIDSEGSTTSSSDAGDLRVLEVDGALEIHLGAIHARALVRGLRHRVPFDREYLLRGSPSSLLFALSAENAWHADERQTTLMLTATAARDLADAVGTLRGRYSTSSVPRVVIELHPTKLTDAEGNEVSVIG